MNILEGKVAFVTGGSGGIGTGISKSLARAGSTVIIGCTRLEKAQPLVEELTTEGKSVSAMQCNVTEERQAEDVIKQVIGMFGHIDILVNNAGISRDGVTWKLTGNDYQTVFDVNLFGPFYMMRAALPYMREKKYGRIINISSVVGLTGLRGSSAYAASKAGIIGLSKSTAKEVARKGITVNVICPGYINAGVMNSVSDEYMAITLANIPMNKLGETEDIGNCAVFLASDSAKYITGEVLKVDGGFAM